MEQSVEPGIDRGSMNDEELRQWLLEKYPGRKIDRDGDEIVVTIPVNFHRRNGRQMVRTRKPDPDSNEGNQINETLVSAITKAYSWQAALESGEYGSIEELATAKKVGRTYAGRVLRLTSLAPRLVEDIVNGKEHELTLRKLHRGIPNSWREQLSLIEDHQPCSAGKQ